MKKTKIICTVGPVSIDMKMLRRMREAGMNGVRINTAFGDFKEYREVVEKVWQLGEIPIILDIKGPEIRTTIKTPKNVKKDDVIVIGDGEKELTFTYNFVDEVGSGDRVLIDNGKLEMKVLKKRDGKVFLLALNDGVINNKRSVNIPRKRLGIPPLSDKDLEAIKFAKKYDIEFLALSFTRNAEDILRVKKLTRQFEPAIMAKIENEEGVKNIEEIIEHSDAVMVARGDLGVDIESEKVPLIQKMIIRKCNQLGKPVVTATQMLESMIEKLFPTRAETSDVANAILDGSDAVMLSGETAVGKFPVESVAMMNRIALETEGAVVGSIEMRDFKNISDVVSNSISRIANDMPLDKIVTITKSGYTARMIARFRIRRPVIAVANSMKVKKQLELVFGITPIYIKNIDQKDRIVNIARILLDNGLVREEDTVLFTAGVRTAKKHASNQIEIHSIRELLKYGKHMTT